LRGFGRSSPGCLLLEGATKRAQGGLFIFLLSSSAQILQIRQMPNNELLELLIFFKDS
jgi:hypothetical protein